jgi:hypothetical protein
LLDRWAALPTVKVGGDQPGPDQVRMLSDLLSLALKAI